MFRLLLVTGTRRTEAAGARWREFLDLDDPGKARWQIPAERFKSNATHLVPLSVDALALVATVPRCKHGDHLFSFSYGERPALALHQAKVRLDALMLRYLRALTRLRGGDPALVKLEPWVVHDLRRVVRTKFAALEVNDGVAEMLPRSRSQRLGTRLQPALRPAADAPRAGSVGGRAGAHRVAASAGTGAANVVALRGPQQ